MAYTLAGFRIVTNGQTLILNSASVNGSSGTIYSDQATTTSVTLPVTVTADTSFYVATKGVWTLSILNSNGLNLGGTYDLFDYNGIQNIAPVPSSSQQAATDSTANRAAGLYGPADLAYKAFTFDPARSSTSQVLTTAGTVYTTRLTLPVAASVTNIVTYVSTQGNTLTASQCIAGLYQVPATGGTPTLVGSTGDQSGTWNSTGLKTMALTGGPFACVAGDYYVAAYFNGTTGPTIPCTATVAAALNNVGTASPALRSASADTGRTTTLPATMGTQTAVGYNLWFALS